MLDQSIAATVETLIPLLRQFPATARYGLAVGGAHAKGNADPASDLDLYIFTESVLPGDERGRLATQFSADIRDVVTWSSGEPFEQAGTDFYLQNLKIECWLRNSASIDQAIGQCAAGIVRRELVTWTTTGFYNHCCLSDLKAMLPVDDPAGILARWQEQVRIYPPRLRAAIIENHLAAARFWPSNFHYHSAIERQDLIYTTGIVQQVLHNLIQVLFAANAVYFPGDKKLVEAIGHLANAPDRFAGRVANLLFPATSASVAMLRSQQAELQALLHEVESLVAAETTASSH